MSEVGKDAPVIFWKITAYWKLTYGVAGKSGLSDSEAQDVVQETLISVAKHKHMPSLKYDPAIDSFKGWRSTMTRWRIIRQFRKHDSVRVHAENVRPIAPTPVFAMFG